MLKQFLFGGVTGLPPLANAGLTLLRIFAGVALALGHGLGKLPPAAGFIERTGQMGFPAPTFFAWAATLSEFLGGAFLALGLFTRPASFFIICTMLTALVGIHLRDPFGKQELAFLYLFIVFVFLLKGAGDWSVDAFLRRK
jgi:putative oxidoreductase